jgi:hypothetical protein
MPAMNQGVPRRFLWREARGRISGAPGPFGLARGGLERWWKATAGKLGFGCSQGIDGEGQRKTERERERMRGSKGAAGGLSPHRPGQAGGGARRRPRLYHAAAQRRRQTELLQKPPWTLGNFPGTLK